jgi:hypothetical protein
MTLATAAGAVGLGAVDATGAADALGAADAVDGETDGAVGSGWPPPLSLFSQ